MKKEKQRPPAPDEWTAEQLLTVAASKNYTVSLRQLERWRPRDAQRDEEDGKDGLSSDLKRLCSP